MVAHAGACCCDGLPASGERSVGDDADGVEGESDAERPHDSVAGRGGTDEEL